MENYLVNLVYFGIAIILVAVVIMIIVRSQARTANKLPRVCLGCVHKIRQDVLGQPMFTCSKRTFFPAMYSDCKHRAVYIEKVA